jgi:hypothetical protein
LLDRDLLHRPPERHVIAVEKAGDAPRGDVRENGLERGAGPVSGFTRRPMPCAPIMVSWPAFSSIVIFRISPSTKGSARAIALAAKAGLAMVSADSATDA